MAEFFPNIPRIKYEGPQSDNPLAFKFYNPEEEIAGIVELTENPSGKPKRLVEFERGESVRITEGPFKHFVGVVEDVNEQKNKLKVMVTVFDRATPVEVDFLQVEKN